MDHLVEILVPLGGMALAFGIVYFTVTTKHKERLRLIESGADPTLFYNKEQKRGQALKFGALLLGIGIGIVLGNLLAKANVLDTDVAYPAMILICGGAALLIGNHFVNKGEKEKQNQP
jgi:hypothetical protein